MRKKDTIAAIMQAKNYNATIGDRIISDMEKFGIVSAPDINKKRTVLVTMEQFEEMFGLGSGTKFGC